MKSRTSHLPAEIPTGFSELNALHPLRPINDRIGLANAYEIMDRLAVLDHRTRDREDYLETLVLLTEAYDKADNKAALKAAAKVSGRETLKYLMDNTDMTQAELASRLGISPAAASMILAGKRPITANHARTLAKRFKVDAGVFL
jgi:antitoxin component HigA of HigAB toxin-antitoxin module